MLPTSIDPERLREVCQRYGLVRLEVFGSTTRGTNRADSDLDLLYTLAPGTHLGWEFEDLALELESVLGRPVDLVSRRALNARIRDHALQEAQPLYTAG